MMVCNTREASIPLTAPFPPSVPQIGNVGAVALLLALYWAPNLSWFSIDKNEKITAALKSFMHNPKVWTMYVSATYRHPG